MKVIKLLLLLILVIPFFSCQIHECKECITEIYWKKKFQSYDTTIICDDNIEYETYYYGDTTIIIDCTYLDF